MTMNVRMLQKKYSQAHNCMRNIDGLHPQEAFDELLKYLFYRESLECDNYEYDKDSLSMRGVDYSMIRSQNIRKKFTQFTMRENSCAKVLWPEKKINLSDKALDTIHRLFSEIELKTIGFDIRSAALKAFIPPEVRKGLGIFLTPDEVVKFMIEYVNPNKGSKVCDPACGSGTFLIENLKNFGRQNNKLFGSDKNPRMLMLAELNLATGINGMCTLMLLDTLFPENIKSKQFIEDESYDYIFTNPPFGVILENKTHDMSNYSTCKDRHGLPIKRQQSEVVFVEKALKMLRPGGTLAIVLPKSIATNPSLLQQREAISEFGYAYSVVFLPPETFAIMGTQTTTILLFMRRYKTESEKKEKQTFTLANVHNVGYDATGRERIGNKLPALAEAMKNPGKDNTISIIRSQMTKIESLMRISDLLAGNIILKGIRKNLLRDYVEFVSTGKTPARKSYSEKGVFLIKVGNLTGSGISWQARDRNYVSETHLSKGNGKLAVKKGDIVMTSSAHNPIYIGKKSDIVHGIPDWIGKTVSYVGEIMLIRPKEIDPYVLLAYFRLPSTVRKLQNMVRGQTAHLHSRDVEEIELPDYIVKPSKEIREISELLKEESKNYFQHNVIIHKEKEVLSSLRTMIDTPAKDQIGAGLYLKNPSNCHIRM